LNILAALGFNYLCKKPETIFLCRDQAGVGDLILIAPTIVALKKKFPKAEITFACRKGIFSDIIANDPNIDKIVFLDQNLFRLRSKNVIKYIKRKLGYWKNCFLYNLKYDLTIFFFDYSSVWSLRKHMIDQYSEKAGVILSERRPILYLNEEDLFQGAEILRQLNINEKEKFIVLGCETGKKGIAPHKHDPRSWNGFPELVKKIKQKYKIKILTLLPKSSEDGPPGTITVKDSPTIRSAAAIIKRSALYIGINCGLDHIASTFDIKMISIHCSKKEQLTDQQFGPIEMYGSLSPHTKFFCRPSLDDENDKSIKEQAFIDSIMVEVESSLEKLGLPQSVSDKNL
jgi:heptosyltransferase III